jgi:major type 1 subunit fimbrin (pilin)
MKNLIVSTLLVLSVCLVRAQTTLSFSGALTGVTCTISLVNSSGFTTTLPPIPVSQFTTSGQTNGKTAFAVQVIGCSGNNSSGQAITQAVPYFDVTSPNVDQVTGNLKNNFSGSTGSVAATNVELQLLDAGTNGQILLNQSWLGSTAMPTATQGQMVTPKNLSNGAATFNFYVQYVSTSTSPTAGAVTSSIPLIMQYN